MVGETKFSNRRLGTIGWLLVLIFVGLHIQASAPGGPGTYIAVHAQAGNGTNGTGGAGGTLNCSDPNIAPTCTSGSVVEFDTISGTCVCVVVATPAPTPTAAPINTSTAEGLMELLAARKAACTTPSLQVDPVLCNRSDLCYWNSTEGTCNTRVDVAAQNSAQNVSLSSGFPTRPACLDQFPITAAVFMFFIATFTFGFTGIGALYTMKFFGVRTIDTDRGKMSNLLYVYQTPLIVYCAVVAFVSFLDMITSAVHFFEPTFCAHVPLSYLTAVLVMLPLAVWICVLLVRLVLRLLRRDEKLEVDIPDATKPSTIEEVAKCKTRCF